MIETLNSMAIEMPHVAGHPNRVPFGGVLTLVDVPSDRAPAGARGRRVLLTRAAAERAIPSLLGMALDYTPAMDGHDVRRKIGIITGADVIGGELVVSGYLFARDFPDVLEELRAATDLGMSYELANARVEEVRAAIWSLTGVTFTGAAVLRRDKAAYERTSFHVQDGEAEMINEEKLNAGVERFAAAAAAISETLERAMARFESQLDALAGKLEQVAATAVPMSQTGTNNESSAALTANAGTNADSGSAARITELEKQNADLKAQASRAMRKTLPASVNMVLEKNAISDGLDASALDAALASLSIEQRIAVKSEMARAGLL